MNVDIKELAIELKTDPLTLNDMLNASPFLAKGKKTFYFNQLEKQLKHLFDSEKFALATNAKRVTNTSIFFKRFEKPLFTKPVIEWHLYFKNSRKRDRKNFIGGLKWLEDCLVSMNIISGDSIEDFESEKYFINSPHEFSAIIIKIIEKENKEV